MPGVSPPPLPPHQPRRHQQYPRIALQPIAIQHKRQNSEERGTKFGSKILQNFATKAGQIHVNLLSTATGSRIN